MWRVIKHMCVKQIQWAKLKIPSFCCVVVDVWIVKLHPTCPKQYFCFRGVVFDRVSVIVRMFLIISWQDRWYATKIQSDWKWKRRHPNPKQETIKKNSIAFPKTGKKFEPGNKHSFCLLSFAHAPPKNEYSEYRNGVLNRLMEWKRCNVFQSNFFLLLPFRF